MPTAEASPGIIEGRRAMAYEPGSLNRLAFP